MIILCITLGVCILVTLANPNGIHIIIYPFQTLTSPSMQQFIQEWFSPDFHQMMWQPLAWLILALIGIGMISKKSISPTNILLTIGFRICGITLDAKHPILRDSRHPGTVRTSWFPGKNPFRLSVPGRLFRWLVPILLGCIFLITSLRFIQVVQEQPKTEAENFPKALWIGCWRINPPGIFSIHIIGAAISSGVHTPNIRFTLTVVRMFTGMPLSLII